MDKWFLDAVESKLNKDRNRMQEFQTIIQKYVEQYQKNRSKIERRNTIQRFKEEGGKIQDAAESFRDASIEVKKQENLIAGLILELNRLKEREEDQQKLVQEHIRDISGQKEQISYEKLSHEYYLLENEERFHSSNRDMIDMEREAIEQEIYRVQEMLHLLNCAKQQELTEEEQQALTESLQRLEVSRKKKKRWNRSEKRWGIR